MNFLYPYNYQMALDWESRIYYLYNINTDNYKTQLIGFDMETLDVVSSPNATFMILDWLNFVKDG